MMGILWRHAWILSLTALGLSGAGCGFLHEDSADGVSICRAFADGVDLDGDGFPTCVEPGSDRRSDCDDSQAEISPAAQEVCNDAPNVDEDCDGLADDQDPSAVGKTSWYPDLDSDRYGDSWAAGVILACDNPDSQIYRSVGGDCDDSNPDVHPYATQTCTGVDTDCDGDVGTLQDADGDGFPVCASDGTSLDCDDNDPEAGPQTQEICNRLDEDCDGAIDEGVTVTLYQDLDGDGYGAVDAEALQTCPTTLGYSPFNTDCDDTSAQFHPGATEHCNGVDEDCDGAVDEGLLIEQYMDGDGDGYGAAGTESTPVCRGTEGYALTASDCDDNNSQVSPGIRQEICNAVDEDCDGSIDEGVTVGRFTDADHDGYGDVAQAGAPVQVCPQDSGYASDARDCDDSDSRVNPGAQEVCNGVDDDCNGTADDAGVPGSLTWYEDKDRDGYGVLGTATVACPGSQPTGYASYGGDCDDSSPAVHPNATEVCDGLDNDCDGRLGEVDDQDGDGFSPCDADSGSRDCDDLVAEVHPDAVELGDRVDNDCDGIVDEDTLIYDDDGDGYCEGAGPVTSPSCGGHPFAPGDCDDTEADVHPGATESVDGIDNDCDGRADEGSLGYDDDGDGYCEDEQTCLLPAVEPGDCDDQKPGIHPGAIEACDYVDQDCDEAVDEGLLRTLYWDEDGDGFGDPDLESLECGAAEGFSEAATDCDDLDDTTWPGAPELCDEGDNDCDGQLDEGWLDLSGDGLCDLAVVPAGAFLLGDPFEGLTPTVLGEVAFMEAEVTNAAYAAFLNARCEGGCEGCGLTEEGHPRLDEGASELECAAEISAPTGRGDIPVTGITFYGAWEYCEAMGLQLPEASQWEAAARGGCDAYGEPGCGAGRVYDDPGCDLGEQGLRGECALYPWGSEAATCELGNLASCETEPLAVGARPLGASIYGLLDLLGNVAEWVIHCPDGALPSAEGRCLDGPTEPAIVGGSWATWSAVEVSIGSLDSSLPADEGRADVGFRCAQYQAPPPYPEPAP